MSKTLINRTLASSFSNVFSVLPVITLTGPRQAADLRGALFENMVINDMMKLDLNRGNNMQQLFFYRDKSQREVDVLRILPPNLVEAYEIKSAQTWNADFFANLNYLRPLLKERLLKTTVVYDGTQESHQTDNGIINFRHLQW